MEPIKGFFEKFSNQMSSIYGKMTALQKVLFGSVGLIGLVGIVAVFSVSQKEELEYLFVEIGEEDTAQITNFLKSNGHNDFIVDNRGIKVPPAKVLSLRLELTKEGLPSKGVVGWEKFDEQNFTRTEFEQKIQKMRAIQGELSRTITAIDGVMSARVHIVEPRKSLFVKDQKRATAAIYLRLRRGKGLAKTQIIGIQTLAAMSVEGLDKNDVTILDSAGNLLTEKESENYSSRITKEMMTYKTELERKLENKVKEVVGVVVGPEKVQVKVDAEVDFTEETQRISDVDPDDVVVIGKQSTGFSMEGSGLGPTGIPGAKSNVPGEEEPLAATGSKTGSKRESEAVNYEVSKVISQKRMAVGNIKRLSISTIVDGKQLYPLDGSVPEFIPRSEEEMKKIEKLVMRAVGFKDGRDVITVENMMFQLDPFQAEKIEEKKVEERQYVSTLAISGAISLAVMLFFFFIVRPYIRWLSYDPDRKASENLAEEFKPDLEVSGMQDVKIQEEVPFEKLSVQEQVLYLAKHEPKRTTEAIRLTLNPHQNNS